MFYMHHQFYSGHNSLTKWNLASDKTQWEINFEQFRYEMCPIDGHNSVGWATTESNRLSHKLMQKDK